MKRFFVFMITIVMILCTGCGENVKVSSTEPVRPTVTPKPLSEKVMLDEMTSEFSQVSSSAVTYGGEVYYLSPSIVNEKGEEGCYLCSESQADILWMPYDSFGRGLYVGGQTLYILTHDSEKYSLSRLDEGKLDKVLEVANYAKLDEKENFLGACIRVTEKYAYVLSTDYVNDSLPAATAMYGMELVRFSLDDGSMQQVKRIENTKAIEKYICANFNASDEYVSYLLAVRLYDVTQAGVERTDEIEVLESDGLKIVNQARAVSRQFVVDKSGTIYYGYTDYDSMGDNMFAANHKLCVKKIGEESKYFYDAGTTDTLGEYNLYFDGTHFIADNSMLSGDEHYRKMMVISLKGEVEKEIDLTSALSEFDEISSELANIIYCDNEKMLLDVCDSEKHEKVLINLKDGKAITEYSCDNMTTFKDIEPATYELVDGEISTWMYFNHLSSEATGTSFSYQQSQVCYFDEAGVMRMPYEHNGVVLVKGIKSIDECKAIELVQDRDNAFSCDKCRILKVTSFTCEDGTVKTVSEEYVTKGRYIFMNAAGSVVTGEREKIEWK